MKGPHFFRDISIIACDLRPGPPGRFCFCGLVERHDAGFMHRRYGFESRVRYQQRPATRGLFLACRAVPPGLLRPVARWASIRKPGEQPCRTG